MPIGGGKYDRQASMVRDQTQAAGVALMVFGGNHGNGFSVQGNVQLQMMLPDILRSLADDIEQDMKQLAQDLLKEVGAKKMATLIRIVGSSIGAPTEYDGKWLKAYDPDARDGLGELQCTAARDQAMRFADPFQAMAAWRLTSTVRPLRDDGKPNRPLSAFHIEMVSEDETDP